MKEQFQKLAWITREKLFWFSSNFWIDDGSNNIFLEKMKNIMLKAIRENKSNLSREVLNDIFISFNTDYRNYNQNRYSKFSDSIILLKEVYNSFDSMCSELLKSFHEDIVKKDKPEDNNGFYVNQVRLNELRLITSTKFDLAGLIRLCEELNIAYKNESYYSVGFLVRVIKDRTPSIFWKKNFNEVASSLGKQSIKKSLLHLEQSLKHIADDMAHGAISRKEILPNQQTVSFQADLDVLLGQIIVKLTEE